MRNVCFVKNLKKISRKDVDIAGGKASSLGELIKIKAPVPNGFVILSNIFNNLFKENEIKIESLFKKINYKDINSIRKISKQIQKLVLNFKIGKEIKKEILKEFLKLKTQKVAVRSSATAEDSSTASWAGELETYLNVGRRNLLKSIKRCWSSLFSPRAVFYRHDKRLDKKRISVAVIVQNMVQSEVSGVAFTANPVKKNKEQIVIEAGYGLGESIVGGEIIPDTYTVYKKDWSILDINIGEQKGTRIQKLAGWQIIKLAQLCCKIENYYRSPQDIEWAMKDNKFYILQSRSITTL